jgi:type I restriction enzyme, S subunit
MNSTPTHWEEVPLKRVLTYLDDRVELDDAEEYTTITIKRRHGGLEEREKLLGHQIKTKKQFRLVPGAFIISRVQCWHQAYAVVPDSVPPNMIASTNYDQFSVSLDVDRRFFWWLSHSPKFTETVRSSAVGVVIEKMVFDRAAWLEKTIPLPPLSEQRRIVVRIEELAAKINEARTLRQQAAEEAEVLLASAMRSHFDFTAVDQQVRDYASVLGGYAFPSDLYAENGSHQIIRIGNVRDGHLDLSRSPVRWDLQDDNRIQRYELKEGDILISMTGTRNKRDYGYVAIVPPGVKLLLNQRVGKVIPRTDLDKRHLAYFLRSPFFRDNLFPRATGTANQANIGNKDIEDVPFDPPTSVAEQRRIVAELDSLQAQVEALKKLQTATATELDALLPSILDKAFKGEL